jgi:aspartate carbamoyltransferase catalytic subunit
VTWGPHLLDVADLSAGELETILDRATEMRGVLDGRGRRTSLQGQTVITLFYEASTRTRVSFETAARRLGADVASVSAAASSITKGESLLDTVRTLQALGADVLVMRHARSGAPYLATEVFRGHLVNAGDGWHAHPSQALLDLFTLRDHLPGRRLAGRKVVILGDILHSRVARSNIWSLTACGADLWLCGPATLLRGFEAWARALPAGRRLTVTSDLAAALRDAHAVMTLRLQQERMSAGLLPSLGEYRARYGLTAARLALARPGAVVLHPGPVNEGVEIAPDVAAGPASLVTTQVANGVAVRMAILELLAGGRV